MASKLNIIFQNDDFLVIDKPFGITVNKSDTTKDEETFQSILEEESIVDLKSVDDEFVNRGGIVHRLDKETSGVIIVAKNATSFKNLQSQFKERRVEKSYIALAHGEIIPEKGEIIAPVGRLPWNRMRFGVLAGGREANTSYETIRSYDSPNSIEKLTLVRLFPKTGRTHQIRVHLKFINRPIFSDPLYGGRKTARNDRKILPRVFLHAESIKFFDPKSEEKLEFSSPLPVELKELLENLENKKHN